MLIECYEYLHDLLIAPFILVHNVDTQGFLD
jgi:hypothetical protein